MPEIDVSLLNFSYGKKTVFRNFTQSFYGSGVYLLTGASGCGKTTLLRLIAGLEKPSSGELFVSDPVAFAFQEYRLFPTISALRNVSCVKRAESKEAAAENDAEALALLLSLGLTPEDAAALPSTLSGGMKQRVSFARALFSPHPIKLLDEVTKELDQNSVSLVLDKIEEASKTSLILFATHRPEDCDRLETTRIELVSPD